MISLSETNQVKSSKAKEKGGSKTDLIGGCSCQRCAIILFPGLLYALANGSFRSATKRIFYYINVQLYCKKQTVVNVSYINLKAAYATDDIVV